MAEWSNEEVVGAWSAAGEQQAADWDDEGDFGGRHLLNPAILALLGSVEGLRILDAGCGEGYLSRLLARRGAEMTGVEPATSWYRRALAREQQERLGITYLQGDLTAPTTMAELQAHGPFDAVVANMVLMGIPDDRAALMTCVAALATGGSLICSLTHPCFEEAGETWGAQGYVAVRDYLHAHTVPQTWAPLFHRTLSHYLNLIIDAGCALRRVVEPQLDAAWAHLGPAHARNAYVPSYLILLAVKA
jgi:2-polyprenyl-3-methyl-5-hydroxy-6-metoxy-1,4-benzoquinol methylase